MSITWTQVSELDTSGRLGTVPVATQNLILQIVDLQIDDAEWFDLADTGRMYLAAHLGTLSNGSGSGIVTSETLGAMSRSYMLPPGIRGALATTRYGIYYEYLIGLLPASLGMVP